MTEEIGFGQRRGRVIIQDCQIGGPSCGDLSNADPELTLHDIRVVLEEQLRCFHEGYARVLVIESMEQVGAAHLCEHVRVHAVCAEPDQDSPGKQFK